MDLWQILFVLVFQHRQRHKRRNDMKREIARTLSAFDFFELIPKTKAVVVGMKERKGGVKAKTVSSANTKEVQSLLDARIWVGK